MDLLDDYLGGVRARGAVFCQSVLEPPWAIRFSAPAPLVMGVALRGAVWILVEGAVPVQVVEHGVVLIRSGRPFTAADHPRTRPQVIIDGRLPLALAGNASQAVEAKLALGPRTFGFDATGSHLFVTAEFPMYREVSERLLEALPDVAVIPPEPRIEPLLALLSAEVDRDEPGQQVVLDRVLDLFLVRSLRSWFTRADVRPPIGYKALSDHAIGAALRRMHEFPARRWTVATLAKEAGLSRAAFARRFADLVGQSPLAYLTDWRMAIAADLLLEPGATVTSVAAQVGYADGFSFSVAFKRVRGLPPSELVQASKQRR
ncbi:AraC family transcriptional regulator [Myxococcus dinghuensis]|uniref:AraC family transcriptional regulator n=1 Tax=Myxococcus dinghuensis TaxID=2906761 RepID=UPI00389967CC